MQAGSGGRAVTENVASETLTRWYEAWNAHDVDAISALTTDDVRYEDPDVENAGPNPGEPLELLFDVPRQRTERVRNVDIGSFCSMFAAISSSDMSRLP